MKRRVRRISSLEKKYLDEVLKSGFRSRHGSVMTRRLEAEFARRFESKFAISFSNGTATMHAALEALGVGLGDEVIVPPLTMASTTFAVLHANATPVFADIDPHSFQIDVDSVLSNITPNTKAVIAVALFGAAPDLERLRRVCDERNLYLIEDNAECYQAKIGEKLVGTFGHVSSYSFQSSKHITSGEGGILLCQDETLADTIRRVQSLGYAGVGARSAKISKETIQNPNYERHTTMGWNYRLGELNAAVALGQVERLDILTEVRRFSGERFNDANRGFEWLLTPQALLPHQTHSYWTWAAVLNTELISWDDFRKIFTDNGGHGFYGAWRLTYQEPMFRNRTLLGREKFIEASRLEGYADGLCPAAESVQPRLVQLRTNYWKRSESVLQARALQKTLKQIANMVTT